MVVAIIRGVMMTLVQILIAEQVAVWMMPSVLIVYVGIALNVLTQFLGQPEAV